jgi:4'-phosphopantetheinyl transferase
MRFARSRAASLLGLQLLKFGMRALGYDDFALSTVSFPRGEKPHCALPIDFNISHSGDLVACAIAPDGRVGIDVERTREIRIEGLQKFLHPRERVWVGADQRRFFELWTQKEAIVKGFGRGGVANLRKTVIGQREGIIEDQLWSVRELNIHPDYVAHVALDEDAPDAFIDLQRVSID